MLKWEKLSAGDVIDIIAPGFPVRPEVLDAGKKFLLERGYTPRVPDDLLDIKYFHSSSDKTRALHAKRALLSPDSKAVWCMRGGYGANRLLPELAKIKRPKHAKVFIGISDVTSLHLFLLQKWKWNCLHGVLLDRLAEDRLETKWINETFDILEGKKKQVEFKNLKPLNPRAEKMKKIKASIVGGNLTTLQSSIGTPWALNLKDQFLFLEDIGERGYRIDRMLEHLKQSNRLKSCKGILLGHFTGGDEPMDQKGLKENRVKEALQRFADENPNLPVWSGIESGHGDLLRTLPLGTAAVLQNNNNEIFLTIESGCR